MSTPWVNTWWKHLRQQLQLWICWDRSLLILHTLIGQYLRILLNKTVQDQSSCMEIADGQQSSSRATDFWLDLGQGSDWATQDIYLFVPWPLQCNFGCVLRDVIMLKGELPSQLSFLVESDKFSSRIFLYFAPHIFPSILTSATVPAHEKHPHNMMLPPLCFTVGMVFFGLCAVLGLHQT